MTEADVGVEQAKAGRGADPGAGAGCPYCQMRSSWETVEEKASRAAQTPQRQTDPGMAETDFLRPSL